MATARAIVALGANLDAPAERVVEAIAAIVDAGLGAVVAQSNLYRTAPVGRIDQPDFINAAIVLETPLAPLDLMQRLLALEARLGRVRGERNGPRRIDLDLIDFDGRRIALPELQLPHPRAAGRAFVMRPWADIAPDARLPDGRRVADVARALPNDGISRWLA